MDASASALDPCGKIQRYGTMISAAKTNLMSALCILVFAGITVAAPADDSPLAWPEITSQDRPWTWWWWHGSAVDKTNLARELQQFHDAGLGGVQFTTIYGVKGESARDIPYLSPKWLDIMSYTVDEAHRLGMGADMSLGSGWCFGGPTVSDQDANAKAVVETFNVGASQKLEQKFNRVSTQALVAYSEDGKCVELTDKISHDGAVDWTAPGGKWTVYAISQKPSGQKVKRAAPGGEGWMLNPLYPKAVKDWLHWFDSTLVKHRGSKPEAVFQDSYEYNTDWSPNFFAQFEKLRGYKLQTELPALFGDAQDERAARVKYDYRLTVSDVMATQSEPLWIHWAHRHGFKTIYQAHGTPGNWLDLYADADIPETEMFHNDRSILISKFASSAGHTMGRQLIGAETGTWLKEHFTVTLADLKYLADDMFLAGINHIYYHGACYSPADAPWPGWVFYASTEMNPRNSIWHDVPALNEYIARCQSILQSGKPDNDVLLYWPVAGFWSDASGLLQPMSVGKSAWFENQPIGKAAHELWDEGYAFDYVSDRQLQKATAIDGEIHLPGGDYKVVVVPECRFMPLPTLRQLLALARAGATIVFQNHLPEDVPGWDGVEKQRAKFKEFLEKLSFKHEGNANVADFGKGRVFRGQLETIMPALVAPEPMCQSGLAFTRRSFDGGWYYLIVNRAEKAFGGWVPFAEEARSAVLLDPVTGNTEVAAALRKGETGPEIRLQLEPHESVVLRVFARKEVDGPRWKYWQAEGAPTEITGEWHVHFLQGGPVLPADFEATKLGSWTASGDTNAQSFAGTAKYEITFDAPDSVGKNYLLNLGDVRQSARVKLNDKDYGTLITPPFQIVADNLKPTGNKLEVDVTNVSANRIRDLDRRGVQWKIFKDINVVNIDYRPFNAADWPLTDSGLLGPVTLVAVTAK